jgi:hypothetical protein
MKKILAVLICIFVLTFSLISCSGNSNKNDGPTDAEGNDNVNSEGNQDSSDSDENGDDQNPGENEDNTPVFDANALVGVWELYCATSKGVTYHIGEEFQSEILRPNIMLLNLNADGTGVYTLSLTYGRDYAAPQNYAISWETSDNCWYVLINGMNNLATIDEGYFVLNDDYNDVDFIFVRRADDELNGKYGLNHIVVENIASGDKAVYNVGDTYYGMLLSANTISVMLNNGTGSMSYVFERSVTTNITYELIDNKFIMNCGDAVDLFNDGNPQHRYELSIEEINDKMCFVLTASNGYSIFSYYVIEQ